MAGLDYGLSPTDTKHFFLVGKENVAEKVKVMENPGIFSKDFKVVCELTRVGDRFHLGVRMR